MEITGKFNIFIEEKTNKDGEAYRIYSTSVGSKDKDGNFTNKSLDVRFAPKNFPAEKLAKLDAKYYYTIETKNAFLGVKKVKDTTYFELIVVEADLIGKEENRKWIQEDLPF